MRSLARPTARRTWQAPTRLLASAWGNEGGGKERRRDGGRRPGQRPRKKGAGAGARGRPWGALPTIRQARGTPAPSAKEQEVITAEIVKILTKKLKRTDAGAEPPVPQAPPRTFADGVKQFRATAAASSVARKAAREALGCGVGGRKLDPEIILELETYDKAISWEELPLDLRAPTYNARFHGANRGASGGGSGAGYNDMDLWEGEGDGSRRSASISGLSRSRDGKAPAKSRGSSKTQPPSVITLPPRGLTIAKIARSLKADVAMLVGTLDGLGMAEDMDGAPWGLDSPISGEDVELLCLELGHEVRFAEDRHAKAARVDLAPRPPIVSIMGHVDHGKTTLLDQLRSRSSDKAPKSLAAAEAGGITQAINAFGVSVADSSVTFLDTPGHAAFTGMRSSGALATDVAVVVIAADDGVKPQTEEVLRLLRTQGVPLVVAMTKVDRDGVEIKEAQRRIEDRLIALEMPPESAGGAISILPVSGVTGEGVAELLEHLALQSELLDLRADPSAKVEGFCLEAGLTKSLGPVATVLVKWGSLGAGDWLVCGDVGGRVRFLLDGSGKQLKGRVGPGGTARVVGFSEVPPAGQPVRGVESEAKAEALVERRRSREEEKAIARSAEVAERVQGEAADMRQEILGGLKRRPYRLRMSQKVQELAAAREDTGPAEDGPPRLKVVLKADAGGTLDALNGVVGALFDAEVVEIEVVHADVGDVTETDVDLAREAGAPIAAFNVGFTSPQARSAAQGAGINVVQHDIIYHLAEALKEDFKKRIEGEVDRILGTGAVLMVIEVNAAGRKKKQVAGCRIETGAFALNDRVRVRVRRGTDLVANDLRVVSLKHFKKDVTELAEGNECGLGVQGFDAFAEGDVVECYEPK